MGKFPKSSEVREGRDGKTYKFPKIVVNNKKEEERAQNGLQFLGSDAPNKPLDLKRTEQLVRRKQSAQRRELQSQLQSLPNDSIQILHTDFRELTAGYQ